jgi:hypothetical protein
VITLQDAIEQIPLLKRAQDAAFKVNLACERLIAMGKFKGLLYPVKLQVYEDGVVTLPEELEAMVAVTRKGAPQFIRDPWFEFTPRPSSTGNLNGAQHPADLGDEHVTYRSANGASSLRLVPTDSGDDFHEVTVSIRTTEDQGIKEEVVTVKDTISSLSSSFGGGQIDSIIRFVKPRTAGWVSLEALFGTDWVEVGRFSPRETVINLRKYSIPGAKEGDIVVGYCKKRFRAVEDLTDELDIASIYCLRMAIEALLSETEGDLKKSETFWALAKKGLSDELHEHRSASVRTVPVYCRAAAGANLRAFR